MAQLEEIERAKLRVKAVAPFWSIPIMLPFIILYVIRPLEDEEESGFSWIMFLFGLVAWYLSICLKFPVQIGLQLKNVPSDNQGISYQEFKQETIGRANQQDWKKKDPPKLTLSDYDLLSVVSGVCDEIVRCLLIYNLSGDRGHLFSFTFGWNLLECGLSFFHLVSSVIMMKQKDETAEKFQVMMAHSIGRRRFGVFTVSSLLGQIASTIISIALSLFIYEKLLVTGVSFIKVLALVASVHGSLNLLQRYIKRVRILS